MLHAPFIVYFLIYYIKSMTLAIQVMQTIILQVLNTFFIFFFNFDILIISIILVGATQCLYGRAGLVFLCSDGSLWLHLDTETCRSFILTFECILLNV